MSYEDLIRDLSALDKAGEELVNSYVFQHTAIRLGDDVEYIYNKDMYIHGQITSFEVYEDGIYAEINGSLCPIGELKMFHSYDFTLRTQCCPYRIRLDNEFILMVDKKDCTKGGQYKIYKVVITKKGEQYFFKNDKNKTTEVNVGEFF